MMNFDEAVKLLNDAHKDPQILLDRQDEFLAFLGEIETCGNELFRDRGDEYILEFFPLIQSAALMSLFLMNPEKSFIYSSLSKSDDINDYVAMSIKFALGLAAMEELH